MAEEKHYLQKEKVWDKTYTKSIVDKHKTGEVCHL